jgi:outer membrane protein TolC
MRLFSRTLAAVTAAGCLIGPVGTDGVMGCGGDGVNSAVVTPSPLTPSPPQSTPAKLSLKECLALALAHNAGYQQSRVALANAESRLRATNQLRHVSFDTEIAFSQSTRGGSTMLSNFGPTLALSQPGGGGLTGGMTVPAVNSPQVGGQAGMEYTLPLLRGGGRGSEVRAQLVQARIDADRAQLTHYDDEQSLFEEVAQRYFDAMRAQDLLRIQEQAVRIAEQATDDTQKRLDAGLIIEIDVTRAKLQLSRTRSQLLEQQQQAHNALDSLVLLLGLPVGAQPELTDTITYHYTPVDEATAIRTALERRPELAQSRLQQADAEVQLALTQTRRKPKADVRFNLSSLGFTLLGGGGIANVLTSLLGLRVSVPMKERALTENIAQAQRSRDVLEYDYEFRRQGIVNDVRRLARAAETARNNIDLLTENVEVEKKNLHSAQRLFEEGLASNRDLLEAQASQTETDSRMLSAKVDYFLTLVHLQRAMGLPLRDYFGLPAADGGVGNNTGEGLSPVRARARARARARPLTLVGSGEPAKTDYEHEHEHEHEHEKAKAVHAPDSGPSPISRGQP